MSVLLRRETPLEAGATSTRATTAWRGGYGRGGARGEEDEGRPPVGGRIQYRRHLLGEQPRQEVAVAVVEVARRRRDVDRQDGGGRGQSDMEQDQQDHQPRAPARHAAETTGVGHRVSNSVPKRLGRCDAWGDAAIVRAPGRSTPGPDIRLLPGGRHHREAHARLIRGRSIAL
jgi:hypothetical protein